LLKELSTNLATLMVVEYREDEAGWYYSPLILHSQTLPIRYMSGGCSLFKMDIRLKASLVVLLSFLREMGDDPLRG
jgi:hypothetical protein